MKIILLNEQERAKLKEAHRREKSRKIADRIKVVLLVDMGWTYIKIAEALLIDEATVRRHINDYITKNKLANNSGGSSSKLDADQCKQLKLHISRNTYTKAEKICVYVLQTYKIEYSVSGMTDWLHRNGFSFKSPKQSPKKANKSLQSSFIKDYFELQSELEENEVVLFGDGVHPTMATKVSHGWILKGKEKIIESSASRTRMNIMGAIDLETMDVITTFHETINSEAMCIYLEAIKVQYKNHKNIHLILDQGSYNRSKETLQCASKLGITIHHLPAYSPNLNPIERLWKYMNEKIRNNRCFTTATEFRETIINFFANTVKLCKPEMRSRINDNFQQSGFFA